jgi:sulfate transport system substrate-binding protein
MKPFSSAMKTRLLVLGSFALNLSLPFITQAAGCCEGQGAFGLEGEWQPAKGGSGPKVVEITNASFETSRELFADLNRDFAERWLRRTGYTLTVHESHASTETEARAILLGADPDVVSFDNSAAIDELAEKGKLLPADWQKRLPDNSAPFTTAVVFLVEKGNPKHIRDWSDLVADGVSLVTPNPETSGRGRWNYLSAWTYARHALGGPDEARDFLVRLYRNAAVLNSNARGSVESFITKKTGDVLILWESDARALVAQPTPRKIEIVTPSSSILVEPPVTYLDRNVEKHVTPRVAASFLKYLCNADAQEIIARHAYRPRLPAIAAKHQASFPPIKFYTVADEFGTWAAAQKQHFEADGIYEGIAARARLDAAVPAPATAADPTHAN